MPINEQKQENTCPTCATRKQQDHISHFLFSFFPTDTMSTPVQHRLPPFADCLNKAVVYPEAQVALRSKKHAKKLFIGHNCCAVCAAKRPKEDATPILKCNKCSRVQYCTTAHKARDVGVHALVCPALKSVNEDEGGNHPDHLSDDELVEMVQQLHTDLTSSSGSVDEQKSTSTLLPPVSKWDWTTCLLNRPTLVNRGMGGVKADSRIGRLLTSIYTYPMSVAWSVRSIGRVQKAVCLHNKAVESSDAPSPFVIHVVGADSNEVAVHEAWKDAMFFLSSATGKNFLFLVACVWGGFRCASSISTLYFSLFLSLSLTISHTQTHKHTFPRRPLLL